MTKDTKIKSKQKPNRIQKKMTNNLLLKLNSFDNCKLNNTLTSSMLNEQSTKISLYNVSQSQSISYSKRQIILKWLIDYRNFVKETQVIKEIKEKEQNNRKFSKVETPKKRLAFRRILIILFLLILALCVIATTTGVLIKILLFDNQNCSLNCPFGYQSFKSNENCTCIDINECQSNPTLCLGGFCQNTNGSYKCFCPKGYVENSIICSDINECIETPLICSHIEGSYCVNLLGSYDCRCHIGQNLSRLTQSCVNSTECFSDLCIECGTNTVQSNGRIVGGLKALNNSWPWFVLIKISYFYEPSNVWLNVSASCGGFLISPWYVVTAAHCVHKVTISYNGQIINVAPNKYQSSINEIFQLQIGNSIIGVDSIIVHENYDSNNYLNDIAILKLNTKVEKTILTNWLCLANFRVNYFENMTVIGYGRTNEYGTSSSLLMQVNITLYPFNFCNKTFNSMISNNQSQICAGDLNGERDSCKGDSGGPLMYKLKNRWYAYGLVSYGNGCARKDIPGVYTNVSYHYNWIKSKIL